MKGITLRLYGEGNDYVGKGLSGGCLVIRVPEVASFDPAESIIIGNTCFYGATSGEAFINGMAGERFAVRNSGAAAVVEGIGEHGCEYMTGGVVIVLGRTGYNFGAGMSGGLAFVLDEGHHLPQRINPDMVHVVRVTSQVDVDLLKHLIVRHVRLTGSVQGQTVLDDWSTRLGLFWKVAPRGTVGSTGVRQEVPVSWSTPSLSWHVAG